jgi:phage baseplate assembly protein gpV
MTYAAAEADRRLANIAMLGVVISVDAGAARASVKVGDLTLPPLPVAQLRAGGLGFWWMPTPGEQVLVICPSGDMAQGVIAGSVFASNAPSSDAGVPMIDLQGGRMVINGDLIVTGDVIASGVSLVHHVHGGVFPGGSKTGEPS